MTEATYCDRCPARASTLAVLEAGELAFCEHHMKRHLTALAAAGAVLIGVTQPEKV